jgi:hypothetical protein
MFLHIVNIVNLLGRFHFHNGVCLIALAAWLSGIVCLLPTRRLELWVERSNPAKV